MEALTLGKLLAELEKIERDLARSDAPLELSRALAAARVARLSCQVQQVLREERPAPANESRGLLTPEIEKLLEVERYRAHRAERAAILRHIDCCRNPFTFAREVRHYLISRLTYSVLEEEL